MRRARAMAILATAGLALAGCASMPASGDAARVEADAEADRQPAVVEPSAVADGDVVLVTTADASWSVELLDAGPVGLDELAMFDGRADVRAPAVDEHVGWVCLRATQRDGTPGSWISDDLRIEVWDGADGPRYDDLTGFDYEPADGAADVYEAFGNALDEPYERVCPIFVVPTDVDFATIAIVPSGGEPLVLER